MAISFGQFRKAVREPDYRGNPPGQGGVPITPIQTFRKAIGVYHQSGAQAAINRLSLPSDYWRRPGRGRTIAETYRQSLRTYFELDSHDRRQFFAFGLRRAITLGGVELNVYIDVLAYDLFGHVARIALWDRDVPTQEQVIVTAAPAALILIEAVGEARATEINVWHLRTGGTLASSVEAALDRLEDAEEALSRAAGA